MSIFIGKIPIIAGERALRYFLLGFINHFGILFCLYAFNFFFFFENLRCNSAIAKINYTSFDFLLPTQIKNSIKILAVKAEAIPCVQSWKMIMFLMCHGDISYVFHSNLRRRDIYPAPILYKYIHLHQIHTHGRCGGTNTHHSGSFAKLLNRIYYTILYERARQTESCHPAHLT